MSLIPFAHPQLVLPGRIAALLVACILLHGSLFRSYWLPSSLPPKYHHPQQQHQFYYDYLYSFNIFQSKKHQEDDDHPHDHEAPPSTIHSNLEAAAAPPLRLKDHRTMIRTTTTRTTEATRTGETSGLRNPKTNPVVMVPVVSPESSDDPQQKEPPPFTFSSSTNKTWLLDQSRSSSSSLLSQPMSTSSSSPPPPPVAVHIFMESLCIDSKVFVLEQLIPTFQALQGNGNNNDDTILNLTVVMFGNAQLHVHNRTVTCQHGPAECDVNSYLQCAIHPNVPPSRYFPMLQCLFESLPMGYRADLFPPSLIASCARHAALPFASWLKPCHDNPATSWKLQRDAAHQTPSYHDHVPWIELNGRHVSEQENLLQAICEAYQQHPQQEQPQSPPPESEQSSRSNKPRVITLPAACQDRLVVGTGSSSSSGTSAAVEPQ
ncbi:hypothetical protein ACA910_011745 [Epithemia clementina (nom. ined.)]